ncbi:hypothetical protein GN958_ATG00360 [Phytophthora infestans]|uniref:Uncharacterized protein n=1 Tax=Phytophthora infestans TaxID=4787 RepID=A0A8S9VIF9_PHYIN|nr:hypothetical protein GN958_ATG00360 [Phytophthora infestans]
MLAPLVDLRGDGRNRGQSGRQQAPSDSQDKKDSGSRDQKNKHQFTQKQHHQRNNHDQAFQTSAKFDTTTVCYVCVTMKDIAGPIVPASNASKPL